MRDALGPSDLVWYVAYGSNLCAERFHCYIEGGLAPGARHPNKGARDTTLPLESRPTSLPGTVYFARESAQWEDGGVAFYDPDAIGEVAARAYLVTVEQFTDVAAQEVRGKPGDIAVETVLGLLPGERLTLGGGWYNTLMCVDDIDGRRALTFTASWAVADEPRVPPSAAYAAMLAAGLAETFGWTREKAAAYLSALGCIVE